MLASTGGAGDWPVGYQLPLQGPRNATEPGKDRGDSANARLLIDSYLRKPEHLSAQSSTSPLLVGLTLWGWARTACSHLSTAPHTLQERSLLSQSSLKAPGILSLHRWFPPMPPVEGNNGCLLCSLFSPSNLVILARDLFSRWLLTTELTFS